MIIERYILRNYIGPFFFSMSVITFVFIMDFILRYIDLFLNKGVAFLIVMQVFALSLGHMFALIIPMAVLPATLMTFGNLASENEITAMKATGTSMYRMILPGALGASILAIGLVFYNNYVLPESNHRLLNLLIDINRKQPTVELQENRFIDDLKGYTIYFMEKNDRTGEITDVQIFKHNRRGLPTSILASRGHLKFLEEYNILRVTLFEGEIHELPEGKDPRTYRRTTFGKYILHIRDVDRTLQRTDRSYRGDREMSVAMMRAKIEEIRADIELASIKAISVSEKRIKDTFQMLSLDYRRDRLAAADSSTAAGSNRPLKFRAAGTSSTNTPPPPVTARNEYITRQEVLTQLNKQKSYYRQIDRYLVEIHKKYSIPFACVIFTLVGAPLAIRMGRAGMNMAIGLSLLFFLVYYVCLIGGEKVADRGLLDPGVAMWSPNVIFGLMAAALLRKAAKEQGVTEWSFLTFLKNVFRRNATANSR
ncbi:MAG: LptF/LptG family permease [Candidatus Krumholzibacteriota bacterium]|nr:LptF/LptG family permease [Candidatus Krumholzibacteriota bacterium]